MILLALGQVFLGIALLLMWYRLDRFRNDLRELARVTRRFVDILEDSRR